MTFKELHQASKIERLLIYLIKKDFNLTEDNLLLLEYSFLKNTEYKRLANFFHIIKGTSMSEAEQNFALKKNSSGRYVTIKRTLFKLSGIYLALNHLLGSKPLDHLWDWTSYPNKYNKNCKRNRKANKRYKIIKYIANNPLTSSDKVAESFEVTSADIRATWYKMMRHIEDINNDDKFLKVWGYLLSIICFGQVHWKYLPKLLNLLEFYDEEYRKERIPANVLKAKL